MKIYSRNVKNATILAASVLLSSENSGGLPLKGRVGNGQILKGKQAMNTPPLPPTPRQTHTHIKNDEAFLEVFPTHTHRWIAKRTTLSWNLRVLPLCGTSDIIGEEMRLALLEVAPTFAIAVTLPGKFCGVTSLLQMKSIPPLVLSLPWWATRQKSSAPLMLFFLISAVSPPPLEPYSITNPWSSTTRPSPCCWRYSERARIEESNRNVPPGKATKKQIS